VPTRKQRRRREKSFRHEYETVLIDEEGNERPVDQDEVRAEREQRRTAKPAAKQSSSNGKGKRSVREVPPPSWDRAFKRGGLMGALMFVLFVFVLKGGSQTQRFAIALVYAVAFVPMTFWIDRWSYRMYLRRTGQTPAKK
jgi:hypothetical protein